MKPFLRTVPCRLLLPICLAAGLSNAAAEGDAPKKRPWDKGEKEKAAAWESLGPEQREKLREALRNVWTDPAVINAREEVKHASEAYQAAIRSAVERADPEVAGLLAKIQSSGGMGSGMMGAPGTPGMMPPRGFEEQIRPPGFLDELAPEMRARYSKAESAAMDADAVKSARKELNDIRKEDDNLRRRRIEAHRKLRKVTVEEMLRIDPGLAEIHKRLLEGGRPDRDKKDSKKKNAEGGTPPAPESSAPGDAAPKP